MDPNVHAIAWALNDSYFYAGSDNNEVRIYDSKGYDKGLIKSMPGSVYDIEVSPGWDQNTRCFWERRLS